MEGEAVGFIEKYKFPLALSFVGLVLIIGGIFTTGLNKQKPKDFPKESIVESKTISVDVSGAVKTPSVYKLSENSRIEDAISASGGFTDNYNKEYVSKSLNLAQKLSDGSKIYVPFEGEAASSVQSAIGQVAGVSTQSEKVNINTASDAQLDKLSGVGPVTSSKIISGRPYQSVEDLLSKKILSKSVFEKVKDSLVVY